jgi:hypothetical protein
MNIGQVELSNTYDVWWRVNPNADWSPRSGGEYHTVELQDGRLGLLRWIEAKTDAKGFLCRSLYLGALTSEPGLSRIDVPARRGEPVASLTRDVLLGAFWRDRSSALQCACLGQTGDALREWLYLELREIEHHLGIFAQSGSGKSYAVARLLEELIVKLHLNYKRARFVLVDPNGDFTQFPEPERALNRILLDVDETFHGAPAFLPDHSWEDWALERLAEWRHARASAGNLVNPEELLEPKCFFDGREPLKWAVIDFQREVERSRAATILQRLQEYIFENRAPALHPTFIIIDEAHNLVPNGAPDPEIFWQLQCQRVINKIAAEGRKFKIFLFLISQSPSKIHPNTLSQCANLIIMRLTTRQDIRTISDLRTDLPQELLNRVATFGQGQALFLGDFVPAPITGNIVARVSGSA